MVSTAICYEVTYPSLAREAVLQGSEMLTTITNDAWYGESSAPYQHFEMAAMRAIEQGRYLVRAANTGISGIVDPYGRVADSHQPVRDRGRRRRSALRAGAGRCMPQLVISPRTLSGRASWCWRSRSAFRSKVVRHMQMDDLVRRSDGLVEARLRDAELSLTAPTIPAS